MIFGLIYLLYYHTLSCLIVPLWTDILNLPFLLFQLSRQGHVQSAASWKYSLGVFCIFSLSPTIHCRALRQYSDFFSSTSSCSLPNPNHHFSPRWQEESCILLSKFTLSSQDFGRHRNLPNYAIPCFLTSSDSIVNSMSTPILTMNYCGALCCQNHWPFRAWLWLFPWPYLLVCRLCCRGFHENQCSWWQHTK